ncbi:mRNA binding protein puf3 [Thecaphora frezii]
MSSRATAKGGPYKHPSVANLNGLAQLSRSTSTNSVPPVRPAPQRSVSGSADSTPFGGFATMASPLATPSELASEDPMTKIHSTGTQRATTASPGVFGVANLPHSGWSDSPAQAPSGASSVWNGRSNLVASSLEGDAIGTATASTVSTPGRATTMGPGDFVGSSFSRSPMAGGDAGAWPSITGAPSPLGWPKDIPPNTAEYAVMDQNASPAAAAQRKSPTDERRRQSVIHAVAQGSGKGLAEASKAPTDGGPDRQSQASKPSDSGAKAVRGGQGGGRTMPKQPPVRSTTLDPSHHLPGQRRYSEETDDDEEGASGGNNGAEAELSEGVRSMSLARNDTTPSAEGVAQPPQTILSPVNTDVPLQMPNQPMPHPTQPSYHSTPQFGHAQRLSASYASFSPGLGPADGFPPSMPYFTNANRSPDAYGNFPGLGHLMPGMSGVPAIDMTGYESYRTTPDPYAPPVPGRPVFMSPAGPGSQGSTPQSPSFGPMSLASLRPNDAMFYPGPGAPYGPGPGIGTGSMTPSARPVMPPGTPQFGYAGAAGTRTVPQSPSLGPVSFGLSSMGMPQPGQIVYPPQSPLMQGQLSPAGGLEQRSLQGPAHQYNAGFHRRMGSNVDTYGASPMMPARPPYPVGQHPGPPMPGPMNFPGPSMPGPAPGWNGRFPDHRRVPTGPGGVMTPLMGYNGQMPPHNAGVGGFVRPPGMHPGAVYGGRPGLGGPMSQANSTRSPLLEEFRSRHAKNRKFELRDILGSIVEFSGDQHGSRFIQEKLDSATEEEKNKVFDELITSARQLMTDVFGNYVIQKMLEHGNDTQRSALAKEMEGHVLALSLGTYGCRVVQKAFDHTDEDQRIHLAKELDGRIMQCVKDQNANHVVQKIIERVDPSKIDFVPRAFQGQVLSLAAHCYSCRVLQRIFEHCLEEQSRPLLKELHADAFRLMQDQYGNYVIQWVLQKGQPSDQAQMIRKIKGQVLPLSRHKFASNVIEEVIRSASPQDKVELIEEILTPRPISDAGPTPPAINAPSSTGPAALAAASPQQQQQPQQQRIAPAVIMMKDQFANYVLQRFLENARGEQKARLVAAVRPQLQNIKRFSNGYAKHLAAIERLLDEADPQVEAATTPAALDAQKGSNGTEVAA